MDQKKDNITQDEYLWIIEKTRIVHDVLIDYKKSDKKIDITVSEKFGLYNYEPPIEHNIKAIKIKVETDYNFGKAFCHLHNVNNTMFKDVANDTSFILTVYGSSINTFSQSCECKQDSGIFVSHLLQKCIDESNIFSDIYDLNKIYDKKIPCESTDIFAL